MSRRPQLTSSEASLLRRTAWRLGAQTALLVLICLVLVGAVVILVVARGQAEDHANKLANAARSVDDVHDAPAGIWVAINGPRGLQVSDGMPTGLPDLEVMADVAQTGQERWTNPVSDGETLTAVTARSRNRVVQAVLDPHEAQEELDRLVTALLVAGSLGVVLAGLAGAWLGRRAVRPTVEALVLQRRFVADASHELRTPLTLLSTRAQLLRRHLQAEDGIPEDSRVPADVDGLIEDTNQLTSILEDMLLAADARSVDLDQVDVVELAEAVVEAARPSATSKQIELMQTGSRSVVANVSAVAVRRAVTALVDNALDHAAHSVHVVVTEDRSNVILLVADDGPGFPDGSSDLFERFASQRSHPESTTGRRHYGLGLALVAEVATQHGGSVTAGPRPDGHPGAALTLRLPTRGPLARR